MALLNPFRKIDRTTIRRFRADASALLVAAVLVVGGVVYLVRTRSSPGGLAFAVGLAVVVLIAFVRVDLTAFLRALRTMRAFLPVAAFSAITAAMGSEAGTRAFDEVGAQAIVVLLLALAIDARFFRLRIDYDRIDALAVCLTMTLLAVGEFYALRSLATKHPIHAEIIAGAIAAGFVAVAVTALAGSDPDGDDDPGTG